MRSYKLQVRREKLEEKRDTKAEAFRHKLKRFDAVLTESVEAGV